MNIEPYLALLSAREKEQENDLLRSQISEYRGYVKELTEVSNIMSKYFYVIVPFSAVEDERGDLKEKLFGLFKSKEAVETRPELFQTYRSQLLQRVGHVTAALSGTGVHVTMLQTEEVIELLYNSYNPSVFSSAILRNIDQVELK